MAKKGKDKPPKGKAPKVLAPTDPDAAERQAQKRIALAKERLTQAMGDPLMRDQIVRAIRGMLKEKDE